MILEEEKERKIGTFLLIVGTESSLPGTKQGVTRSVPWTNLVYTSIIYQEQT